MPFWSRRQQMGWAALVMGASILLSRFMGLIRDKMISLLFGASKESDLYFASFVIPDFINYLLAGAYFSTTLIPLLATLFQEDERDGWRFFSTVFNWIAVFIAVLTAVAMAAAPQLARLAAPGLDSDSLVRLTYFLRIILPAQVFFLLGSCLTAILYLRKQFYIPAMTPVIYNLLIMVGGVLLRHKGMEGFCWGVLAGAFLGNFLLPLLAVWQGGGLKLQASLWHPSIGRFLLLALPLMLGQSIVVLDEQLARVFGSLARTGAISWLSYARRIMMVPVGVVAQAAGVASYPFLAELAARGETSRLSRSVNGALRGVLTLLMPLSAWMIVISEPTIRLIFQQGHFGAGDTEQTAHLLRVLLLAVNFWGFQQILGRAFYATQDTLSPAILGTAATLLSLPVYVYLTQTLGATGVAIASALSIGFYALILAAWWSRRHGIEALSGLAKDMFLLCALSLAATLPAWLITRLELVDPFTHPYIQAVGAIGMSGMAFWGVFIALGRSVAPALVRPYLDRCASLLRRLKS